MINKTITIELSGINKFAIQEALEESLRLLGEGYQGGQDENEEGGFYFGTKED